MTTHKFQVKLYVDGASAVDLEAVIPVFHAFIREDALGEMLMDVVDYGHVQDGPGVVLIGHASDYYVEQREGRPGVVYSRKRDGDADATASLREAVRSALRAAVALEAKLPLRFRTDDVLIRVNDRLAYPNDDAGAARLVAIANDVLPAALGGGVSVAREGTPRELLTVRAKGGSGSAADALARLG